MKEHAVVTFISDTHDGFGCRCSCGWWIDTDDATNVVAYIAGHLLDVGAVPDPAELPREAVMQLLAHNSAISAIKSGLLDWYERALSAEEARQHGPQSYAQPSYYPTPTYTGPRHSETALSGMKAGAFLAGLDALDLF